MDSIGILIEKLTHQNNNGLKECRFSDCILVDNEFKEILSESTDRENECLIDHSVMRLAEKLGN